MDKYNEFVNRYNVKDIRVQRPRPVSVDYYNRTSAYYNDRDEMVEMEMPRRHFDFLVETDYEYTKLWQDQKDEAYMRKQYPAIKDAYEKYRMLLELYK